MDKNEEQIFLKELRDVLDGDYYNAQEEDWAIMQFINSKTEPIAKQLSDVRNENERLQTELDLRCVHVKVKHELLERTESDLSECKAALEEIVKLNYKESCKIAEPILAKLQTPSQK